MIFLTKVRRARAVRWTAFVASVALLAPLTIVRPAGADPVGDKQAEAARLAQEIEVRGQRVSMLAEQLDRARLHADEVRTQLAQVEADAAAADQRAALAKEAMRQQAVSVYVRGAQRLTPAGSVSDPTIAAYLSTVTSGEQDVLDRMRAARARLEEERTRLRMAQREAADALGQVSAAEQGAEQAVKDEQAVLDQVHGDLAQLVAAAQQQQAAATAASVQADMSRRNADRASRGAAADQPPPAPEAAVSPGAAGAVEEAQRQLGKPYRYGGAGPNDFDCSGLTMWAWGHAGRSLPHSAAAQYSATARVAISDLQPGDLVFYGKSIYHMGIYVGNGQMIEAPHTGAVVRYASIYRPDLMGAGRP